ncbi:MAG: 50S ribosomal protein L25 [Candidatus Berkelbacteria bacterium]|nr:50S ribosomal protein L25 [Candidatus Berkelbacteria bacterium]
MTEFKLKAELRAEKTNQLRHKGRIPAIIYGKNFEPIAISMDKLEFDRVFRHAGTSNLIDMTAGEKKFKTLVHDFQLNPLTEQVLHVDFLKINMKEKIHAEIPIKFEGTSTAVIQLEGSLITPIDSIEIECLPADLPAEIVVDISILDDFEKNIKISDLAIPAGVEVLSEPEEIIAFVQEPRSEEELEALTDEVVEDVDAIEVENKGEETEATETEEKPESEEK